MGDHRQSLVDNHRTSESEGRSEREQYSDALGLQSTVYESQGSKDSKYQDLDDGEPGSEVQEEEIPPEELAEEEFLDVEEPGEAPPELEKVLEKDKEEDVPEMRWARWAGPTQAEVGAQALGRELIPTSTL